MFRIIIGSMIFMIGIDVNKHTWYCMRNINGPTNEAFVQCQKRWGNR
jgi:hypothetical protein